LLIFSMSTDKNELRNHHASGEEPPACGALGILSECFSATETSRQSRSGGMIFNFAGSIPHPACLEISRIRPGVVNPVCEIDKASQENLQKS